MNIFIMADMEGVSGVYSAVQVDFLNGGEKYQRACKLMANDINACASACKKAGVNKVYLRDCHAMGGNINYEDLSSDIDFCILGSCGQERFPHIEECDGVILLGYHAMAGTQNAVLEHTMSSKAVQNYKINGRSVGEIEIDAAIVGGYGKPVIMVSGDDKTCCEAKKLLPNVTTCEVKKAHSVCGATLIAPHNAYKLIEQSTIAAIENIKNLSPYVIEAPVKLTIELTERSALPNVSGRQSIKIIDGRTFEICAETVQKALLEL